MNGFFLAMFEEIFDILQWVAKMEGQIGKAKIQI